jgi:hypothetical protein
VTVRILNLRATSADDEERSGADRFERANGAVHAAGKDARGRGEELFRVRVTRALFTEHTETITRDLLISRTS